MGQDWNPKIGISREERRNAAAYGRRFGWVDVKVRIRRGMRHRKRQLYVTGFDKDQIKWSVRYDYAIRMKPPSSRHVARLYKKKYFILRAKQVHGDKYDYSLVENDELHTKWNHIKIICPRHGVFNQSKENHVLVGRGCPTCAYKNRRAIWTTSSRKE